jgi:NAD dependent epimerase/dehydratase family enzyme
MKVLLTGATGLIGSEVGKQLSEAGIEVVSLTRDAKRARRRLPFLSEVHEWTGGDAPFPDSLRAVLQTVDGVVNLMGENISDQRWSAEFKNKLITSRVSGTKSLVEEIKGNSKLRVWIQGSAIGVYGSQDRGGLFASVGRLSETSDTAVARCGRGSWLG